MIRTLGFGTWESLAKAFFGLLGTMFPEPEKRIQNVPKARKASLLSRASFEGQTGSNSFLCQGCTAARRIHTVDTAWLTRHSLARGGQGPKLQLGYLRTEKHSSFILAHAYTVQRRFLLCLHLGEQGTETMLADRTIIHPPLYCHLPEVVQYCCDIILYFQHSSGAPECSRHSLTCQVPSAQDHT